MVNSMDTSSEDGEEKKTTKMSLQEQSEKGLITHLPVGTIELHSSFH